MKAGPLGPWQREHAPVPRVATIRLASRLARGTAHAAIRAYQLTLSGIAGRQCRYLPTCSAFVDEAIVRHGLWGGGWMGLARICRCHPWGDDGFDPVPETLSADARWSRPWRYGTWHRRPGTDQERARRSAASP